MRAYAMDTNEAAVKPGGRTVRQRFADVFVDFRDGGELVPCSQYVIAHESMVLRTVLESTPSLPVDAHGQQLLAIPRGVREELEPALDAMHAWSSMPEFNEDKLVRAIRGARMLWATDVHARLLRCLLDLDPSSFATPAARLDTSREFLSDLVESDALRLDALDMVIDARPLWSHVGAELTRTEFARRHMQPIIFYLSAFYPGPVLVKWAVDKLMSSQPEVPIALEEIKSLADLMYNTHPAEMPHVCGVLSKGLQDVQPDDTGAVLLKAAMQCFTNYRVNRNNVMASVIEFEAEPIISVCISSSRGHLPTKFEHTSVPWMTVENDFDAGFFHASFVLASMNPALSDVRFVEARVLLMRGCDILAESWYGFEEVNAPARTHFTDAVWKHEDPALAEGRVARVTSQRIDLWFSNTRPRFTATMFAADAV